MDEMKKYIIEFSEDPHTIRLIKIKNGDKFPTTEFKTVTPYTEDSAYAHGYTEAESKYREIRDELEKQAYQRGYETAKHECEDCQKIRADAEQELVKKAYDTAYADAEEIYESGKRVMYQKGLKDAWECARKICDMKWTKRNEVFGIDVYADIIALPVSECIEKIRQYEQKKEKEEIKVGDEVNAPFGKAIVVNIDSVAERIWLVYADGHGGFEYFKDAPTKTGRHFPEIAEVLAKMKETE